MKKILIRLTFPFKRTRASGDGASKLLELARGHWIDDSNCCLILAAAAPEKRTSSVLGQRRARLGENEFAFFTAAIC
ncbi:MAG: hypothetical protein R3C28_18740 [Pirellulaceae bacterium]